MQEAHRIVIVGGGAGGLELATRLGETFGRRGRAQVTLVDRSATHMWKPLLHEVAAGTLDVHAHQVDYHAQARWHGFSFVHGAMNGLQRDAKTITVAPLHDDTGAEVVPQRSIAYDTLVIALGSITNTFNTPGVAEHAFSLDTAEDAERFRLRLVSASLRADYQSRQGTGRSLNLIIVGGGATGVELAAELHYTMSVLTAYGLRNFHPERDIKITLLNADPRILPMLPERLSAATTEVLRGLGVQVECNQLVTEVGATRVACRDGKTYPSDLTVWAAGIKAPDFLKQIDGLETNRINQLAVHATLQTTLDPDVFAFGDCAACPWIGLDGKFIPPRAQAAHQQATVLAKSLADRLAGRPPRPFHYRDFGSLVSLGEYSTVGSLMGFLSGRSLRVEGLFARFMYMSLYKLHELALHGAFKVALDMLARTLKRRTEPRIKLH
jgi:NADH dehydrogenase